MVTLRNRPAILTFLAVGLLAGVTTPSARSDDPKPEVKAVLDKVRNTYRNLDGYHFERVLLVEELNGAGKPKKVGELTIITATAEARLREADKSNPPLNLDRCRLEFRGEKSGLVLACNERSCLSYTIAKKEYMKGKEFSDVNTSVGGSMLLTLHMSPFAVLADGAVQDDKAVREEEVEIGKDRRKCQVIEGSIKPRTPADLNKPPTDDPLGLDHFLSLLSLQGVIGDGPTMYSLKPLDGKAAVDAEPTRLVLWIDKETLAIVRCKRTAKLFKVSPEGPPVGERVEVVLTDSFTVASLKAPAADCFRFTPPEGAKEVPNVDSRRNKKK